MTHTRRHATSRSPTGHPFLWIMGLGLVVYAQTFSFDFTHFDDNRLILDYQAQLSRLSTIPQAFTENVFRIREGGLYYRPMLTVSFVLDTQWGRGAPFAYHVTNVLLHLAAACLLFLFLCDLQPHRARALFAALVFTVHPVLTQAVAWIPGRNDSLAAVFLLASFLAFRQYTATRRTAPLIAHIACWAAALFTKETAVTLPILCLAAVLLIDRARSVRHVIRLLPLWALVGCGWFLARHAALENPPQHSPFAMLSALIEHLPALPSYVGKIVCPWPLSVFPILTDLPLWPGVLALCLLSLLAFAGFRRQDAPALLFGLAWFVLFLLPAIAAPSISATPEFLEHRVYVPLVGLALLFTLAFPGGLPGGSTVAIALAAALLCGFSAITIIHSRHFRNRTAFWEQAVASSPHAALAHNSLGYVYYSDGRIDAAEREWRTALALNPAERLVHGNLGILLMNRDLYAEAEREFRAEIANNPVQGSVYLNMGKLYFRRGEPPQNVLPWWEKAVEFDPTYTEAYTNLIGLSYNSGDRARAKHYIQQALAAGVALPAEMVERLK